MAKTLEEKMARFKEMQPCLYYDGERIENWTEHPVFQMHIAGLAQMIGGMHTPEWKDDCIKESYIAKGAEVDRWCDLRKTADDWITQANVGREYCRRSRCVGCLRSDMAMAGWATAWEIDQKYKTNYHDRFKEWLAHVHKEDLFVAGALIDARGDRSKPPYSGQPDPDSYLRIVEKRKDGIVVRGVKPHASMSPLAEEVFVCTCQPFAGPQDKDWAVAFSVPIDTKGVKFIFKAMPTPKVGVMEYPFMAAGGTTESWAIFDDALIPWERVFMAGEWEFGTPFADRLLGETHAWGKCQCKPGIMDMLVGLGLMIGEANGVPEHAVKAKLIPIMAEAEQYRAMGIGSAMMGSAHPSGVWFTNSAVNAAIKYQSSLSMGHHLDELMDLAGGSLVTAAGEKNWFNPETRPILEKYWQGNPSLSGEDRFRAMMAVRDYTMGGMADYHRAFAVIAGGGRIFQEQTLWKNYPREDVLLTAKAIAGIEEKDAKGVTAVSLPYPEKFEAKVWRGPKE